MAIRTYKVTLDSKNTIAPEPVLLRQGDKTGAVVIDATLVDNGVPIFLDGLTPMFKANTADGQAVITDSTGFNIVNASGGEFTYQVPSQLGSVYGRIQIAYFSFSDSTGAQSTFDVAFIVKKAADMTQESAKDWDSNLNKIISQYNQWVNNAHSSWQDFVNENKKIIESIDPGGTLLNEVIAARKDIDGVDHKSLSERLESTDKLTKVYDSIDDLRAANLDNGNTVKTQIDGVVQNWKITDAGYANGYSVVRMANGLYACRIYNQYNNWLNGVDDHQYAAHKGFNGTSENAKRDGLFPGNTIASFKAAANVGFKFIELDARITADGDWVVIHDTDTKFLTGETANISEITTSDLLSRTVTSEYTGYGHVWNYSGSTKNYSVPLLADALKIAKDNSMFVMVEVKESTATDDQITKIVDVIKKSSIENQIILFGGMPALVYKIAAFLPNVIVGFMNTSLDSKWINTIKSYPNHFATFSKSAIDVAGPQYEANNVPWGVWAIDSYSDAQSAFKKGAMLVTTNRLLPKVSPSEYKKYQSYNINDVQNLFRDNPTVATGTTALNNDNELVIKSNGNYYSKSLAWMPSEIKAGSIIKITCTAKTVSADPVDNVGRIYINNNTSGAVLGVVEDVMRFDEKYYQTKTMYYPITRDMESNNTILSIGLAGQAMSGTSEMVVKEFSCEVLAPTMADLSNERYCNIFAWDNAPTIEPTIRNKGITSIAVDSSDHSVLNVNYEPFYDASKKPVVFTTTDNRGLATGYNNNRFVAPSTILSGNSIVKLNVYNADGTKVTDLRTGLRTSFNLLIKG